MEWQRHESLPSMSHFYGVLEFEMHFTIFLTDELMPKEFFFFFFFLHMFYVTYGS